ncbi:MAG: transglycosylase SLT domain-containing protein [bacterium]
MKCAIILGFLAGLLLQSQPGVGAIYRFQGKDGVTHYTNTPKDPKFKLFLKDIEEPERKPSRKRPSNLYDRWILEASLKHNVDFALIKAIIRAESGFNPHAVSKKGAKGLMQLMPETAKRMKVSDVFNPRENIEGGVSYFKHLLSLFDNNLRLSLAAYNAGETIVAELGTVPPYRETVNYVKKVLSFYNSYKD